jgi:magnesium chelatase family protein
VIEVPSLPHDEVTGSTQGDTRAAVGERVGRAFARQIARQGKPNSRLTPREIESLCPVGADAQGMLRRAVERLHLSVRAYHRILKVARSIADLDDAADIRPPHVAEAIQYRRFLGDN